MTPGMHKDAVFGLITLAVVIAYYLAASAIPDTLLGDAVGAAGLPKLYAYILGAFAVVLIVRSSWQPAAGSGQEESGQRSAVSGQEEGRQPSAVSRQETGNTGAES